MQIQLDCKVLFGIIILRPILFQDGQLAFVNL